MADAADSKSVGLKTVRVQVPPPARKKSPEPALFFIARGIGIWYNIRTENI